MSEEMQKRLDSLQKTMNKYGKYIEELEKNVAQLKENSHPPLFSMKDKDDIIKRLEKLEEK